MSNLLMFVTGAENIPPLGFQRIPSIVFLHQGKRLTTPESVSPIQSPLTIQHARRGGAMSPILSPTHRGLVKMKMAGQHNALYDGRCTFKSTMYIAEENATSVKQKYKIRSSDCGVIKQTKEPSSTVQLKPRYLKKSDKHCPVCHPQKSVDCECDRIETQHPSSTW